MTEVTYSTDVFLSYAHVDNMALSQGEPGWVDTFARALEVVLAQRSGRTGISLWRDTKLVGADLFDQVVEHRLRESSVFVAVVSPGYLASAYCQKELESFLATAQNGPLGQKIGNWSRVLPVFLEDIPLEERPPGTEDVLGFSFFTRGEGLGPTARLQPDDQRYRRVLDALAYAILETLKAISDSAVRDRPVDWSSAGQPRETPSAQTLREAPQTQAADRPHQPDVFISYAREDREVAKALAVRLEAEGWSVFWDRDIPIGRSWDQVLEDCLAVVKAVVVLWSSHSIRSEWVLVEANEGADGLMLVPALAEDVRPPLRFRRLQGADLTEWGPRFEQNAGVESVVSAIRRLVSAPDGPTRA